MTGIWKIWMQTWCWAVFGLGVMFALSAFPAADAGARLFYDAVHWPLDGASSFGEQSRFSAALIGAITIGWALTTIALVNAAEQVGAPAWRGLTFAISAWYVIDSLLSIASGVPGNAVSNTGLYAAFLAPILGSGVLGSNRAPALSVRRS